MVTTDTSARMDAIKQRLAAARLSATTEARLRKQDGFAHINEAAAWAKQRQELRADLARLQQERDAALAERDRVLDNGVRLSMGPWCAAHAREAMQAGTEQPIDCPMCLHAALTEARRVLREISELLPCDTPCANRDAEPPCPTCGHEAHVYKCAGCMARGALAAVLAQEEK